MDNRDALQSAESVARQASVIGWAVFGFLIPIIGIPVAHLRSPNIPPSVLVSHEDSSTVRFFELQYVVTLKQRQVRAAWIGSALGVATGLLVDVYL